MAPRGKKDALGALEDHFKKQTGMGIKFSSELRQAVKRVERRMRRGR